MTAAFIGLGANVGRPREQLDAAIAALGRFPRSQLLAASSFYASAPQGHAEQPDFINAVAKLETGLEPRALLEALLALERASGRERSFRGAPRTLDLDLLLYGEKLIAEPDLLVPHPRMHERAFVLMPLAEIAPRCVIPGRGPVSKLLAACAGQRIERLK
ncbi:MAG: 2-amino-4-hydroxy-6-hydroxymethyldihydropteridine diphosphokinase [Betaproteobacteria bacterium]|nr:2-amino-4-hydroxy-6-hydroxymethyldihydropteridine diphosphokinase [Betaproteobacteria bacterium]